MKMCDAPGHFCAGGHGHDAVAFGSGTPGIRDHFCSQDLETDTKSKSKLETDPSIALLLSTLDSIARVKYLHANNRPYTICAVRLCEQMFGGENRYQSGLTLNARSYIPQLHLM